MAKNNMAQESKRLQFLIDYGCLVVWSRDYEVCSVVIREDDDGQFTFRPLTRGFLDPREAIDAAIASLERA